MCWKPEDWKNKWWRQYRGFHHISCLSSAGLFGGFVVGFLSVWFYCQLRKVPSEVPTILSLALAMNLLGQASFLKSQTPANAPWVALKSIWSISPEEPNPPIFPFVASLIWVLSRICAQWRWEFCLFAEKAAPGHKWNDGNGPDWGKMGKKLCSVVTLWLELELKGSFYCRWL